MESAIIAPMPDSPPFFVVGIGASAGGITALQTLFEAIPSAPNIAFVVVQHLLPDQPSQLARLFCSWTQLPVREAADDMPIRPGCVYIAPPGRILGLEDGKFTTRQLDSAGAHMGIGTIDSFLESLADSFGSHACAVILSGTSSDGATGAIRIKQAGGMVLAQDPNTAMYDGMPTSVIANGSADHIMPLGALAQELLAFSAPEYVRSTTAATWADDVSRSLGGMIDLIRARSGFDLSNYRTTPLLWRIQRRMQLRRVPLFRDYEALLHDDPTELETLIRSMPIYVTGFFRDKDVWTLVEREVIPDLVRKAAGGTIRAWTTACSSGEEAYSLAMLLAEQAEANGGDFRVFATDASAEIVARAARGTFKPSSMAAVSPERKQRFFYAADGNFYVKRTLREKMVFAPQDLLADPPIAGIDLITCRNLLIYLEPDASKRVIRLLHSALRIGGYLFLGNSESLQLADSGFDELVANSHVYRKIRDVEDGFAFPKRPMRLAGAASSSAAVSATSHEAAIVQADQPAVLVDDHFRLLRVYGDTSGVLQFKPGEPTLDLLELLPPLTSTRVEHLAQEAKAKQEVVTSLPVPDPAAEHVILGMKITPMKTADDSELQLLISFMRPDGGDLAQPTDSEWSNALRVSHAELDSSREELQALNEELRASNDQLNSANEELNHANAQLRDKIDELATQSDVMSSGAVMTLFLDKDLRMRFFTAGINELFPVIAADVGRRITDLVPNFEQASFVEQVQRVMTTQQPEETEVRTSNGHWYMQRIRPFHAAEPRKNKGGGVAITYTDITDRKRVEDALQRSEATLAGELAALTHLHDFSTAVNNARTIDALVQPALDAVMRLHGADMGDIQLYDPRSKVLRVAAHRGFEPWFLEHDAQTDAQQSSTSLRALERGERVSMEDVRDEGPDAAYREVAKRAGYRAVQSTPLMGAGGALLGMVSTYFREPREMTEAQNRAADIISHELAGALERITSDETLRESEQSLRRTQSWIAAEKEAFQSEMNGAPLEASLGILVRAAIDLSESERRGAFFIANAEGTALHHVVGMPPSYGQAVDGFKISLDSLACGLAVATGKPVITRDVLEDPRWKPWTWLANEYAYRACWSFPVETAGKIVGTFAMYFAEPREPTARDHELAATLAQTAAMIMSRHHPGHPLHTIQP